MWECFSVAARRWTNERRNISQLSLLVLFFRCNDSFIFLGVIILISLSSGLWADRNLRSSDCFFFGWRFIRPQRLEITFDYYFSNLFLFRSSLCVGGGKVDGLSRDELFSCADSANWRNLHSRPFRFIRLFQGCWFRMSINLFHLFFLRNQRWQRKRLTSRDGFILVI